MGIFSNLFGNAKPKAEALVIPEGATSAEIIDFALHALNQKTHGTCATLEVLADPTNWVQLMDHTINCYYPHQDSPELLFPEIMNQPIVAGLEEFDNGSFMHISLNHMNASEIVPWIEQYFCKVLSVDFHSTQLSLRMEDI